MSSTFCCQGSTELKGVPPRWRWVIKCFYNIEHQTQNLYQHSGKTSTRTWKGLHIKNERPLDIEHIKLDLKPIKTSRTLLALILCFSASMVVNSARANSIVSFNKLTTPNLHDVEGSLWPEELIKPEAKFNKRSEAEWKVLCPLGSSLLLLSLVLLSLLQQWMGAFLRSSFRSTGGVMGGLGCG